MCTILQYITHQSQMITDEKFVNKLQFTTSISIDVTKSIAWMLKCGMIKNVNL